MALHIYDIYILGPEYNDNVFVIVSAYYLETIHSHYLAHMLIKKIDGVNKIHYLNRLWHDGEDSYTSFYFPESKNKFESMVISKYEEIMANISTAEDRP